MRHAYKDIDDLADSIMGMDHTLGPTAAQFTILLRIFAFLIPKPQPSRLFAKPSWHNNRRKEDSLSTRNAEPESEKKKRRFIPQLSTLEESIAYLGP